MSIVFSPSGSTFHDDALGVLPGDAVPIGSDLHASLLAARSEGARIVMGPNGAPVAMPRPIDPIEQLRARAIASVKREASARILALAPLWRQINDARELALSTGDARAAIEGRIAGVDAIRAQSDALENRVTRMSARAIATFNPASPAHW
jgi:hypothetical protein